jgi:hypothetical protein
VGVWLDRPDRGMRRREGRIRLTSLLLTAFLVLPGGVADTPQARPAGPRTPHDQGREGGLRISIDPRAVIIGPDDRTPIGIEVEYLDGFTSAETDLWVRGTPPRIRAHFERDPLTHSGHSVLWLRSGDVVPGRYPIVVGASGGDARSTVTLALEVGTTPGFDLRGAPAVQWVAPGGSAVYEFRADPRNGFRGPLSWRVDGLPDGVHALVDSRPMGASVLIRAGQAARSGRYRVVMTAAAGTLTRSFSATLGVGGTGSSWQTARAGSTGFRNNTVRVGNARNDGVRRVYVGTVTTGQIYEFTWGGNAWSREPVGASASGQEIHNMTIGPGRDDGVNRIYACSSDGRLYEFSWNGSGWDRETVGVATDRCYHAEVGRGRNDGRNRVYAARDSCAREYIAHGLAVGRGRGGARNRVYIASDARGTFEASFGSGRWRMRRLGDSGDIRNVSVGAGRNDGRRRVYAAVGGGRGYVREFTWNDGRWRIRNIGAGNPVRPVMVHVYAVKGRNDGRVRLYGAGGNGSVYEYTWRPSTSGWRRQLVGGSGSYMYGFHFGRARRDSVTRLYGADFDGDVWQFTWR